MDIYICTDDVRVGRALALEAQAAGFSAAYGRDAADVLLSVRDLDFALSDGASDGIAFSRDEERLRAILRMRTRCFCSIRLTSPSSARSSARGLSQPLHRCRFRVRSR